MVYNDPERPEIARERQDVESPPLRVEQTPHHTGRGKPRQRTPDNKTRTIGD